MIERKNKEWKTRNRQERKKERKKERKQARKGGVKIN